MPAALEEQLRIRVRTVLRSAAHPAGAAGTTAQWRGRRDRWTDALDPCGPLKFDAGAIRELIDFLAESGPSPASHWTSAEWDETIDALTAELLFSSGQAG